MAEWNRRVYSEHISGMTAFKDVTTNHRSNKKLWAQKRKIIFHLCTYIILKGLFIKLESLRGIEDVRDEGESVRWSSSAGEAFIILKLFAYRYARRNH